MSIYSVALPPLAGDERVVVDSVGSLLKVMLPTQGRVVLTNQRIFYMPWYLRYVPQWPFRWSRVEIQLGEIRSVGRRAWLRGLWGGFPGLPVFRVSLKDGSSYTFQVFFAGYWLREIEKLIDIDKPPS